jgi:Domain of unknown function (DUF5666)
MRYTALILPVLALSLAACGSSSNPTPAASGTSSSTTAAPNPKEREHVAGLVASVSGNAIQVTQRSGTATVDFTNSTKFAEISPAQLSDVTPGSCVTIRGARDNPGPARSVLISPSNNGQCPQPQGQRAVGGSVTSVSGNTITVATAGNPTNVTVAQDTAYARRQASNAQAIAQGKCVAASGTKDNTGALQATAITVRPASNGNCPGTKR